MIGEGDIRFTQSFVLITKLSGHCPLCLPYMDKHKVKQIYSAVLLTQTRHTKTKLMQAAFGPLSHFHWKYWVCQLSEGEGGSIAYMY